VNYCQSRIIFFFLFLVANLAGIAGKTTDSTWFAHLRHPSRESDPGICIDSINNIPYDLMVSNLNGSAHWFHEAIAASYGLNYEKGLATSFEKMGIVKYLLGEYDSATYYNLQAINLFEKLDQPIKKGSVLCTLGYGMKRRNLVEAFLYYRKGLAILEHENSKSELCAGYDNFGVLFEMKGDLDSALYYYSKALLQKQSLNDSIGIPYSLNNIGLVAMLRKDFETARQYFTRAYEIRLERKDSFGILENESYFGDLHKNWQHWDDAIKWYLMSNVHCDSLNYPNQKKNNLEQLSQCYESSGMWQLALDARKQATEIGEKLLNEQNSKTIIELEQRYKAAEKDKNIIILQKDTAEKKQIIYLIAAILVLLTAGSIIYYQIQKRKARQAKDAAIIAEREAGLRAVFDATEEERKRIAKDLHDGIGQQLSGLKLNWAGLGEKIDQSSPELAQHIHELSEVLDDACKEVRNISHQMMPKALQQTGLLPALQDLLKKSLSLTPIKYKLEHFKVENIRFDERIEVSLYRITQELLNNIIKHSQANEVLIQLFVNKKHLILIVEDNGKGFNASEEKDGIGLMNISSRINTISGEVIWEPGPKAGTVATVRIPIGTSTD
jgi:signal transduction histidine kinase